MNIPHLDDWAMFAGDNHPASIDLPWLFAQHNEHRMITTKLFVWIQFHVNGWDVRTHLMISFLIYGCLLVLLGWCGWKWMRQVPTWIMPCFIVFLLTPITWFNHFMASTVSVHLWLLFFFGAAYLLFSESQRWSALAIAWAAAILSIYSWAAGFVTALILLIVFSLFKSGRIFHVTNRTERRKEILQLTASVLVIGSALIIWTYRFQRPPYHVALVYPYKWQFWTCFGNLLAFGFGIYHVSTLAGFVCLLVLLAPICGMIWLKGWKLSAAQWAVCASVLALLGNECAVSMGRAGFGTIVLKLPEYAEMGLPLVILTVISWALFLDQRRKLQLIAVGALWLVFFFVFFHKWGDFGIYQTEHEQRIQSVSCVRDYYEHRGDGRCRTAFPPEVSLAPFLEQAKRLNASFYRELNVNEQSNPSVDPK